MFIKHHDVNDVTLSKYLCAAVYFSAVRMWMKMRALQTCTSAFKSAKTKVVISIIQFKYVTDSESS